MASKYYSCSCYSLVKSNFFSYVSIMISFFSVVARYGLLAVVDNVLEVGIRKAENASCYCVLQTLALQKARVL